MPENQDQIPQEVMNALAEGLKKAFDKRQDRPDQYVVVYKRQDNDEIIGYHADTFCTMRKNILEGKRYAGEDPYPQLKIIAENFKYMMKNSNYVDRYAPGLQAEDVYIDAIYLAEGTPKQSFYFKIINNGTEDNKREGS